MAKYKKTYPSIAAKVCREHGFTDIQLAKHFKVHKSTINRWKHEHPEFAEKMQEAKDEFDAIVVENALLKRARGYSYTETHKKYEGEKLVEIKKVSKQ